MTEKRNLLKEEVNSKLFLWGGFCKNIGTEDRIRLLLVDLLIAYGSNSKSLKEDNNAN